MSAIKRQNVSSLVWEIACLALLTWCLSLGYAQSETWELAVCADPDAMPLSDRSEQGYENLIAEIIADQLGATLVYDWYPYGQDLINLRLRAGHCDVVMGVPDGQEPFLTTLAYYISPFVFIYRSDSGFDLESLDDPVLHELSIGIQNVSSPPHDSLLQRGLSGNLVTGFTAERYEDVDDPLATLVHAVSDGEVDVGVVWGPIAGYYALASEADLEIVSLPTVDMSTTAFTSLALPMTIGVRQGDDALRDRISIALAERWEDIQKVLDEFGVPREQLGVPVVNLRGSP